MKILLVISSLECGGAESHFCALAENLVLMGHTVVAVSSGGRMADELEARGVRHIRIRLCGKDPFEMIDAYFKLLRLMKTETFDIVHVHTRLWAFLAYYAARRCKVPFTTTVHASFRTGYFYSKLSRWGNICISVSEDLSKYLADNYRVSAANIRVIPNGIDTELFASTESTEDGTVRVVFASRLDADCSSLAFLLCDVSERIREKYGDVEFYICGGGDKLAALELRSADKPFFHTLGRVTDMPEFLKKADLFIGVSRAALEAMSCGVLTVLGGDEGYFGALTCEESVRSAALGNFCCRGMEKASEERLYRSVCKFLDLSKEERERISRVLSEYVRDHHDLRTTAKMTESVYREVIERHADTAGRVCDSDVVLCGYYGYGNMGDNALFRSAIGIAKKRFTGKRICALTRSPRRDAPEFNILCAKRMSPLSIKIALSGASVLVFGGGTLLQDGTSLRSLLYYAALIRYASSRGIRVELWGNGIGEPRGRLGEWMIGKALSKCSYVGLRDLRSLSYGLRLVGDRGADRLFFEPDLAIGQTPSSESRVRYLMELYGISEEAPYAVVAPRGSAGRGYRKIMLEQLALLRSGGVELLFVPMFVREDLAECRKLCGDLGGSLAENITESDIVGLIMHSRIVCGMRLHSLVFAASAGVPFVGFGGDPKIEAFCQENGGYYFTDSGLDLNDIVKGNGTQKE